MSVSSWLKEYMPTPADKVEPGIPAIMHSLRKWEGLRRENRERHGLAANGCLVSSESEYFRDEYDYSILVDSHGNEFELSTGHSACGKAYSNICDVCPVSGYNAQDSMDNPCWQAFYDFCWTGDPEPMIAALKQALERAESEASK